MNAYQLAATALALGIAPCALVCARSRPIDGLVALALAGVLATLALLCLAEGYHRATYFTVALVCATERGIAVVPARNTKMMKRIESPTLRRKWFTEDDGAGASAACKLVR